MKEVGNLPFPLNTFIMKKTAVLLIVLFWIVSPIVEINGQAIEKVDFRNLVSAQMLYNYVDTLSSDEFEGRLTGHIGYDKSAEWVIEKFKEWDVQPLGDDGNYLQHFPHPYTEIFPGCEVLMHVNGEEPNSYNYIEEFIPGSTSGNGEITAGVIYVGYGTTAPELGYDDYAGVDVSGKIVLMEREVPVNTSHENFLDWRPYSFHQYKLLNAVEHGAAGMLYNYHIANPNNAYSEGFIYSHIGKTVMENIFDQTGEHPDSIVKQIKEKLQPRSFKTEKTFTIKNETRYHPDGVGSNVIGFIKGTDPVLKNEYIFVGGHLDHLGRCYEIMPGANDNASGVSVTLGIAAALAKSEIKLKRSVVFILMGAEEAELRGVQYFLKNPTISSRDNIKGYINMDAVGIGSKIHVGFAENYPVFYSYLENANQSLNFDLSGSHSSNIGRPRLDAAFFDWYGIPVLSINTHGESSSSGNYQYHTPFDDISNIEPEIMLNLAELLFHSIVVMANEDQLNFNSGEVREEFIK